MCIRDSYNANLCITSNDPDPGSGNETDLVVVPVTLTVEALPVPPNIDVSPLSLASTQATNTTTNQPLTVANTGGGTLNWIITEEPGTLLPIQVEGPMAAMVAAQSGGSAQTPNSAIAMVGGAAGAHGPGGRGRGTGQPGRPGGGGDPGRRQAAGVVTEVPELPRRP